MRKTLATFVMLALLVIALPLVADAQCQCRTGRRYAGNRSYNSRRYYRQNYNNNRRYSRGYNNGGYARQNYYNQGYSNQGYYRSNRPSFYRRHRNAINIGVGTGAGALLGGIFGGRRGAGIGALVGAGGSALYTYKIRPKKRRY